MIKLVSQCSYCKGTGQSQYAKEQECSVCNGSGKKTVLIGCIVEEGINLGDHGEIVSRVADVSDLADYTLREFLEKIFQKDGLLDYHIPHSVTFRTAFTVKRNF